RLLMESLEDYALFTMDPEGGVFRWGVGAERILGYSEPEIVGQNFARFFTPDDLRRNIPLRELERTAKYGHSDDDRWHVCKDGSRRWVNGVTTALRDEHGQLRGFAKVVRDRTEQYQLHHALEDHAHLLDLANAYSRKPDGHLALWTKGCENLYGFSRSE